MNISEVLTFAMVAALLVMSPGPNGALIARTVPASGHVAGFANVAGFVAAFYLHGTLSILGISVILVQSALAFTIVKYLGAAYLCWIGITALREAWRGTRPKLAPGRPVGRAKPLRRALAEGFLTNALNPKVSMFYLAAFPQFLSPGDSTALSAFALVTVHAAINALWFSPMVLLFARLVTLARSGRFQRGLKAATGAVFIGFGLKLACYRPGG